MNEKKRLLVIPHLFYPEVASTAQIYTELFSDLQDDFDITVLCAVPCYTGHIDEQYKIKGKESYEENYGKIKIIRVPVKEFDKKSKKSRILHVFSYRKNAKKQIRKLGKFDVTFVCSQPPIVGGMLGVYAKKKNKSRLIYNIQDFNPEQAQAVMSKNFKLAFAFMGMMDQHSCKKADEVIVVGRDMAETLERRFKDKDVPKHVVINNWIDEKEIYPLPADDPKVCAFKKKYGLEDKFVIIYSGNIGLYYDLKNILRTIHKVSKDIKASDGRDVVFAFVGAGSILDELKAYKASNGMDNVVFIPYQKKEDLVYSLNAGDAHWVINAKGIKGVSVPSKCYGVMAAGKPILGVLEKGSECERIIVNSGCGFCCEPGNYAKIKENILYLVGHVDGLEDMGKKGRECLCDNFTKELSVNKYKQEIESL